MARLVAESAKNQPISGRNSYKFSYMFSGLAALGSCILNVLSNKTQRPILIIMAAVMLWGLLHALGAYLFEHDFRKPLIVCGVMLAFLAAWAVLLANRGRNVRREHREAEDVSPLDNPDASQEKSDVAEPRA